MTLKPSQTESKWEKPPVGKLDFTEEDIRNSPFIQEGIARAKRFLEENPFPIELLQSS